jgi:hypothetical protein
MEPSEIWARVTDRVRQEIADPTVWIAMQQAKPLLIDGSFFVAALPKQEQYLAAHLLNNQATIAVEDALRNVANRILAFRLVIGDSAADWEAEKRREQASGAAEELPAEFRGEVFGEALPEAAPTALTRSAPRTAPIETHRDVSQTWEKLAERLNLGYKAAPFIKYPHGQAQYVLTAVKLISDTMDVQMPPEGSPREDAQERALTKIIERLSGIVNLDAMFIALELLRYRELHGKNTDIAL